LWPLPNPYFRLIVARISVADKSLLGLAAAFLTAIGAASLSRAIPPWIGIGYAVASLVSLCVYAWDKNRARKDEWRVAESTLHFLDLVGGWPGALVAQRLFRHKNRKLSFQIVFWFIVVAHFAFWFWIVQQRF
jgi:uncharacterized membrane protein YsdA (DUF1294 family)